MYSQEQAACGLSLQDVFSEFLLDREIEHQVPNYALPLHETQSSARHSLSHVHSLIFFFPFLIEHTVQSGQETPDLLLPAH